jgi:prophage DNA circulation protein
MAWRDRLRKASFRDVPFEVEEDQGEFGRRVQTHEFPQRDKPYTEDLGRATRRFNITGFVLGAEYMDRHDALLNALEAPGPGALVHPWLGTLQVNVEKVTASHSLSEGGVCRFHITFVEAGEITFPTASASRGAQSLQAADKLQQVAEAGFTEKFQVKGMPSPVADGALKDLRTHLDVLDKNLSGMSHVLANPLQTVKDQFQLPQSIQDSAAIVTAANGLYKRGTAVLEVGQRFVSTMGGFGTHARNHNTVLALTRAARELGASTSPGSGTTPAAQQRQANSAAIAQLLQHTTLAQAAGMASAMPMPVYDDGLKVRDALTAALDDASVLASDEAYQALQDVRAKVHADLTSRLAGAARLESYSPRDNIPALVVAYDRYEDIDREQEIVERNAIRHPGFVPVRPLRLLSA